MQNSFKNLTEKVIYWFDKFGKMLPGNSLNINQHGKNNPEMFTDLCKLFIDNGNPDFELSEDKKYFKRINNF